MKISSMGSLLKSLVVLSILFGYVATATARPSTVSGYGQSFQPPAPPSDDYGSGTQETFPEPPETPPSDDNKGLFDLFPFRFFFGNREPPPENDGELTPENGQEPDASTNFLGSWKIDSENAGVSAMHIQLMPNNKAVWYDSTSNGISEIDNNPPSCRPRVGGRQTDPQQDCTAHAIQYDVETAEIRPLKVDSSPWCSSGGLARNGDLISTGGDKDGFKAMRILKPCENCDFQENPRALFANRWYATQHALEDGSFVVVGGRESYNYEIVPPDTLEFTPKLREQSLPICQPSPDGNLFVFANYKSIILNPYTGEAVRQLPDLPGGSRNYPPSGMSALLPINLNIDDGNSVDVEVLVCGGNTRESYILSDMEQPKRTFLSAFTDCGRLNLNTEEAEWEKEDMPSPRVMGSMLLLPTGDVLIINGAKAGTSAWDAASDPSLTPVLYSPNKQKGNRFQELAPSTIPRMYHSVAAVLPDGQILVAKYGDNFTFPTELRVEKFSPLYLDPELKKYRLQILEGESAKKLKYGGEFNVEIESRDVEIKQDDVKVTMYSPPFTTHGYSMNQRLLILKLKNVNKGQITVVAPPSGRLAPPGYYLLFVVYRDVPSRGMWVHIE
ncbi:hypothetical protein Pfo_003663 [Paulownia fortunei]|nr:hypothetical protein Pfo_003663 [Paulownia fortunei]